MSNYRHQLSKLASVINAMYEDAMHSPTMKKQALEDVRTGYLVKVASEEDLDLTHLLEDSDELPFGAHDEDEETDEEDLSEYLDDEYEAMEDFEYPASPGPKFY